jgi:curved DNA-binding protein CbpA
MPATKPKNTPLDVKGYYRLLKVSRMADIDEIRLSYAMAKQNAEGPYLAKLEKAYETLKIPQTRAKYDAEGIRQTDLLRSPFTLAAAIVVLIGAIVVLWLPEIQMRMKRFEPGQELVSASTRQQFGTVVNYDPAYQFPGGNRGPAYLVRLTDGSQEKWFPAIDLQATCE